ncbi:MAG TPA: hypothetical protein VI564_00225 [Candidatus Nanoarchaeia archaeon]|nr:hypothetical protein [Candidatus Nanoarchaeia archaeon]
MVGGHRIGKKVKVETLLETIKRYTKDQIHTTNHTFFRLNEKQRKIFKDDILKDYLLTKIPILAGIQFNGNYAVFYDYSKNEVLRLMLDIQPNKIKIVTFYLPDRTQVPRL